MVKFRFLATLLLSLTLPLSSAGCANHGTPLSKSRLAALRAPVPVGTPTAPASPLPSLTPVRLAQAHLILKSESNVDTGASTGEDDAPVCEADLSVPVYDLTSNASTGVSATANVFSCSARQAENSVLLQASVSIALTELNGQTVKTFSISLIATGGSNCVQAPVSQSLTSPDLALKDASFDLLPSPLNDGCSHAPMYAARITIQDGS